MDRLILSQFSDEVKAKFLLKAQADNLSVIGRDDPLAPFLVARQRKHALIKGAKHQAGSL